MARPPHAHSSVHGHAGAERSTRLTLAGHIPEGRAVCVSVWVPGPASAKDAGDTLYGRTGKPFGPSACSFHTPFSLQRTSLASALVQNQPGLTAPSTSGKRRPVTGSWCAEPLGRSCGLGTPCAMPSQNQEGLEAPALLSSPAVGRTTASPWGKFCRVSSTYPRWPSLGACPATLSTSRTHPDPRGNQRCPFCPCFLASRRSLAT